MSKHFSNAALTLMLASLVLLSGCEKDGEDSPVSASSVAPAPRPAILVAATGDIKSGRPAEAQSQLETFLAQEPDDQYAPEAHYLLGQALAAQGRHEDGKNHLDKAIDTAHDRALKALAMLGRADCNLALNNNLRASRQYHWIETMYRDVKAIPQDELMYKLGLATKRAGFPDTADYWFNRVIELYATGPYAADSRRENSRFTPTDPAVAPRVYTLEVNTYGTLEKAESEAAILRSKGYRDVEIVETTRNNVPKFEVHLGKFGNKNDAVRAQTDAELAGLPSTIRPSAIAPLK